MAEFTDKGERDDAIRIAVHEGMEFCDEVVDKWWRGEYGGEAQTKQDYIAHWKRIKEHIRDFRGVLRESKRKDRSEK